MEKEFSDFRAAMAHRLRQARGDLTQAQLAQLTGYTQQMISRYESGRIPRSFWFLANLSSATGLDVDHVLTGRRRRKPGSTRLKRPA
ncbi:MAG: helix-turn-helix domain-containing protein [Gemmatimonadota bacterium]